MDANQNKKLKNYEESVAKKQIEPRHWELKIVCATKEESYNCDSALDSNSGFTEQGKFLVWCKRIFTILTQRQLEHPTFPANPWLFRVPEGCLAAILDCRSTHGILWVLQETFSKAYLQEKDHPQLPVKIHGIRASSSCGLGLGTTGNIMEHGRGVRREPQSSSIPTPRFNQGIATLNP